MKSSFSRFLYPGAIILLAALMLVGIAFQYFIRDYMNDTATQNLTNDGNTIAHLASAYYTEGSLSSQDFLVNLSVISQVTDSDAVICNRLGQLILCSDAPLGCEHQGMVIDGSFLQTVIDTGCFTSTSMIQGLYPDTRYVVSVPILDRAGYAVGIVIVSAPITQTQLLLKRMSDIFIIVSVLVVAVAVLLMTLLARQQTNPLREMARAARDFGHGKLDARVRVESSSPDEVKELALAFNNMASSLQKSEYQRQEFVANVSHELKTPMTTISGMVDGILDGTIPKEKQTEYMQLVSDETKRLSRLVRSMLDISRLQDQGGIPDSAKTRFDLCECCSRTLLSFESKINAKQMSVEADLPEHPVYTFANQDYIIQVVYNLLDNAVKFCPQEGLLKLQVRLGSSKAYVTVSNSGETIPPEELPLLFDRFHKIDKSRSKNRDSWGLGLYIVKTIVCSHGENISVSSHDGMTEFTFTLPLVS